MGWFKDVGVMDFLLGVYSCPYALTSVLSAILCRVEEYHGEVLLFYN